MSDNDAFDGPASTAQLEKALRQAVGETYRNNPEQLTVKRLRTSVEHNLGLENGFFKGHEKWNVRSKDVIHSEVVRFAGSETLWCLYELTDTRLLWMRRVNLHHHSQSL